jgi:hypothetical protein
VTPSTRPALGTTNVSTFRSCSATASAPRLVTKADDLRSQHNPAPAGEGRNGVIRSYWLPSATYRRDSRRTLTSVSSVNRTLHPRLEADMLARRREPPRTLKTPLTLERPEGPHRRDMLKAGAPQHLQRTALLRAGLVEENDPHASGRQQRTRTHADHHRTASTDAATVSTSTQNARNATPENPKLRRQSPGDSGQRDKRANDSDR